MPGVFEGELTGRSRGYYKRNLEGRRYIDLLRAVGGPNHLRMTWPEREVLKVNSLDGAEIVL